MATDPYAKNYSETLIKWTMWEQQKQSILETSSNSYTMIGKSGKCPKNEDLL